MKEGINRQQIHTFWRKLCFQIKIKQQKGVVIHASGACGQYAIVCSETVKWDNTLVYEG
jgi:hypothetical protein